MKPLGIVTARGNHVARISPSHVISQDHKIYMSTDPGTTSDEATQWIDEQRDTWRAKPSLVVPLGTKANVMMLGSDPEMFVVSATTGKVIPAYKFLPSPQGLEGAYKLFWDGFQAEFTMPAQQCLGFLVDKFQQQLHALYTAAKSFTNDAKLDPTCLVEVDQSEMDTALDEHVALGCSPSINIYDIPCIMVGNPRELTRRVAGCHVHMQFDHASQPRMIESVKMIDKSLLLMSMGMLEGLEDTSRREYYGRPGEIRFPASNRLEYRAFPSTIQIHPALVHFHFDIARLICDLEHTVVDWLWEGSSEEAVEVVMSGDIGAARAILQRNEPLVRYLLQRKYYHPAIINATWRMIMEGAAKFLPSLSIESNWKLNSIWNTHSGGREEINYSTFARTLA